MTTDVWSGRPAELLEGVRRRWREARPRTRAGLALAAVAVAVVVLGERGVDQERLEASVEREAQKDWELRDDFQRVEACFEVSGASYACAVSGDDGVQLIGVSVSGDDRFRVAEPAINTFFGGEIR